MNGGSPMNIATFARIAKIVALFGFLLPWVLVSCSNQPLFSATGMDLAMGSVVVHDPMNGTVERHSGHTDIPILLAMIFIAVGLLGSFQRNAARVMLATSLSALVLTFVGVQTAHDPQQLRSAMGDARQSNNGFGQAAGDAALAMLKVENQFGYYLTMFSLAAAGGLSFAALYGVDALRTRASELSGEAARRLATPAAAAPLPRMDPDIAFWDAIADKNDPDLLHEYLIRFPSGRFTELARAKLDGQGRSIPKPAPVPQSTRPNSFCPQCGGSVEFGGNFCEGCGTALTL
jgi:hypothetical protein